MALFQATSKRQSKLRCVLDPTHRDWRAGEFSIAGAGLEAIVFFSETPNPSRAHEQLRRVLELLTALRERSEV